MSMSVSSASSANWSSTCATHWGGSVSMAVWMSSTSSANRSNTRATHWCGSGMSMRLSELFLIGSDALILSVTVPNFMEGRGNGMENSEPKQLADVLLPIDPTKKVYLRADDSQNEGTPRQVARIVRRIRGLASQVIARVAIVSRSVTMPRPRESSIWTSEDGDRDEGSDEG